MRRGLSIARGMAVIAVLALTCGTLRLFLEFRTLGGMFLPALGLQAGLIGVLVTRGRRRRFCAGLALACMVLPVLFMIGSYYGFGPWSGRSLQVSFRHFPAPLTRILTRELQEFEDAPGGIGPVTGVVIDLALGGPQLLVAVVVGILTAFVRLPSRRPPVAPPVPAPNL